MELKQQHTFVLVTLGIQQLILYKNNTNGLAGRRLDYSTSIAYDYVGFRVTLFLN